MRKPTLPSLGDWVDIHYHRPHKGTTVFRQQVLEAHPTHVVTYQPRTALAGPLLVGGSPVLRNGSPVIWFTMPGWSHDIGIFHLPDGRRTGLYANVLTPVQFSTPTRWLTTDLFLDWWVPDEGEARLLDQEELEKAHESGLLGPDWVARAKEEAEHLRAEWLDGAWPPDFVDHWTLKRAQRVAGAAQGPQERP
ncbi:MAG: DUF402 domain-containing protein [Gemmatimonadetes bacterium]|nr:DUF402 domain-containing protein [Gemmatimonadota bacterium]